MQFKKIYPLVEIPKVLDQYFEEQGENRSRIAKTALGIGYQAFRRRLNSGRLHLTEIQAISDQLELEVRVHIGPLEFSTKAEEPGESYHRQTSKLQEKIIGQMEANVILLSRNQKLEKLVSQLEKELIACRK